MKSTRNAFVFVLMPFKKAFRGIYKDGIKAACRDVGATCERVDKQFFRGTIHEQMYDQIAQADVLVADITGDNPNVLYEIGWGQACGKEIICLIQKQHRIPFDLAPRLLIKYAGSADLRRQLAKRLTWLLEHPAEAHQTSDPTFKRTKAQVTAKVRRLRMRKELRLRPALEGTDLDEFLDNLDFEFAWGGIRPRPAQHKQVVLHWSQEPWAPPSMVADVVWGEAYAKARFATEHNRDFRFRPLGRVADAYVKSGKLNILLEPTMYALFAATNLNLDNENFREIIQNSVLDASEYSRQPFLASALNVIGCVFGKRNCVLLPKRSNAVFQNPGTFQASTGGFVEEHEKLHNGKPAKPHQQAAAAFAREVREELGIELREDDVEFLGFGYNRETGEPDLIAMARTDLTADEMKTRYEQLRQEAIKQGRGDPDELASLETGGEFTSCWELGNPVSLDKLTELCCFLREGHLWSDPSDIVAVLGGICRVFTVKAVTEASRASLKKGD